VYYIGVSQSTSRVTPPQNGRELLCEPVQKRSGKEDAQLIVNIKKHIKLQTYNIMVKYFIDIFKVNYFFLNC
jgi:hypothetical protein